MKILFLSGPALGHVSRLVTVANALNNSTNNVDILFAVPNKNHHAYIIIENSYPVILIDIEDEGIQLNIFPKNIERLCNKYMPDIIIVDWNMLRWASNIIWPKIPRILITNIFLTKLFNQKTTQDHSFEKLKEKINLSRIKRNLTPIYHSKDLYDADIVCLADPCKLVKAYTNDLPPNYVNYGAILYSHTNLLKSSHRNDPVNQNILISMGSTGKRKINQKVLKNIIEQTNVKSIYWVGGERLPWFEEFKIKYYKMTPLHNILKKSILVITQGGTGSTYQALSYGIPILAFPTHQNHKILSSIIEDQGVGLFLKSDTIDLSRLQQLKLTSKIWSNSLRTENTLQSITTLIKGYSIHE